MNGNITIALDAMGGDHAPGMVVKGAEIALQLLASRPAVEVGKALRRRALSSGRDVTRYSETLKGQAALSNRQSRAAFLRTL